MNDAFLQTLCGCDCLTPFNHSNKPKCKFCGKENIDWPHLLFECEKRNGFKTVSKFLKKCREIGPTSDPESQDRFLKLSRELSKLWDSKDFTKLFYLMMAVNLHEFDLEYFPIIELLVSTITPILYSVQSDWTMLGFLGVNMVNTVNKFK